MLDLAGSKPTRIETEDGTLEVLFYNSVIKWRIKTYAEQILEHLPQQRGRTRLVFVTLMDGAGKFWQDLQTELNERIDARLACGLPAAIDIIPTTLKLSSRRSGIEVGSVELIADIPEEAWPELGRADVVYVVEDLVDTGATAPVAIELTRRRTRLNKPIHFLPLFRRINNQLRPIELLFDPLDFDYPEFVVGYNLDYLGKYRLIPHLCRMLGTSVR